MKRKPGRALSIETTDTNKTPIRTYRIWRRLRVYQANYVSEHPLLAPCTVYNNDDRYWTPDEAGKSRGRFGRDDPR